MKTLQEILARKSEIRSLLQDETKEVDLEALETELRGLEEMEKKIEKRQQLMKEAGEINKGQAPESRSIETFNNEPEKRDKELEEAEKRGKALKENRSVTIGSTGVLLADVKSGTINPTFNQVSSLLDRVAKKTLTGGESYQQSYITGYGEGDYGLESADYNNTDVTFGYANITKSKITAYAEDTEELQKLPVAAYDAEVQGGISVALRKKITREILLGDGTTNHLAGIFSTAATAIDATTDLAIDTITNTTLDEIVYSYGGNEDVEDAAVLILNKKDLKAFVELRSANGERIHKVVTQGNTGTIDGIPFVINSACKPLNNGGVTAAAGEYAMAYGPLSNYQLTIFSDIDIRRSDDYKFKQGMIAHRGSVFVGGNVTSQNGFLRIKRKTAIA